MAMNITSCIFCGCQIPLARGTQDKYVEHLQVKPSMYLICSYLTSAQSWHMMTVAEEVERALQIASVPQKVTNRGPSRALEATNSITSKTSALPSNFPPSPISLSSSDTVRRSPSSSLVVKANESCLENGSTIAGCCFCFNLIVRLFYRKSRSNRGRKDENGEAEEAKKC